MLDLAAPKRQIPAAIAANPLGTTGEVARAVFEMGGQHLSGQTTLGEHNNLQPTPEALHGQTASLGEI